MAKKLLSEAQMRRFAKLANLEPVNEMYHKRDEEEVNEEVVQEEEVNEAMHEDEEMKEGMHADEEVKEGMHEDELDAPAEMEAPAEEPEMEMAGGEEMELTDEEAQAIIDLADKLRAAMEDAPAEMEAPAEEPEMEDALAMAGEEEEMMEALSGIQYVSEQKDIVEEVARRVAKRLLKAKKANQALEEALSTKK